MNSKCDHHADEIFYVCSCNQFLCERCRIPHQQLHEVNKQRCTLREIQNVREETDQKISDYIQHLDIQLKNIKEYKHDIASSTQFTEGFELITRAHNEVKKLTNAFFKVIESDFDKRSRLVKQDYEQNLQRVENKLIYTITTFQELFQGLRSLKKTALWQKTLDVALSFDFKEEMSKIDAEVESVIQEKFYISVNSKSLDSILEELHNYIQILTDDHKSNVQYTPTDEILLPKNLDVSIDFHHKRKNSPKKETILEELNSSKRSNRPSMQGYEGFEITMGNYFHKDCPRKILHFFEAGSKNLYIIPLEEIEAGAPRCHKIELNIKSDIPHRHRSVITPFGEIYLTGGSRGEEELAYTFKLNVMNGALLPKRLMPHARKSHGFCYMNDFIYAIGGYNTQFGALPYCEKYDIAHDKWIPIAQLTYRTSSPSICTFNDKYIFKFGGLEGSSRVSEQIEKYDVELDRWSNYQVHTHLEDLAKMNFKILWLSASCQLNDRDIIVFGGCDEDNKGSKQTFLFEVIEGEGHETACNIVKRNTMPLPYAAGFWNSQCIIQNGKMYSLQNELMEQDISRAYENSRNLLVFDGSAWQILKVSFSG